VLARTAVRASLLPYLPRPGPAPYLPDRLERGGGAGRAFFARPLWRWHVSLIPGLAVGLPEIEDTDSSSVPPEASLESHPLRLLDGNRTGVLGPP